jgi:hypothetical protein
MPDKDKRYLYSVILSAAGWSLFLVSAILLALKFEFLFAPSLVLWFLCYLLNLIAMIYGVLLLYKYSFSIKTAIFKIIILLASVIFSSLFIFYGYISLTYFRIIPPKEECSYNLNSIYKAMISYSIENKEHYPTASKWCDLLIQEADVSPKTLLCPNDKKGLSSYAINPNAEPNSPDDVVLLFEAKPGWNQFGGKELLNTENHKGEGANVLLKHGGVYFIKKEDFGKLNWGIPQEPNKIQNIK